MDGSWVKSTLQADAGWYVLNCSPPTQLNGGTSSIAHSALQAEVLAYVHCLIWAKTKGFHSLRILIDSSVVIQLLKTNAASDIHLFWSMKHLLNLGKDFRFYSFCKVPGNQVHNAHDLAKLFRCNS